MAYGKKTPDEIRIGACADYLLGIPIATITHRWGVKSTTLNGWIKRTGSFKVRVRKDGHYDPRTTFSFPRPILMRRNDA